MSDAGGLVRVCTIMTELRRQAQKTHTTRADLSLGRTIDETVIVKNWTRCENVCALYSFKGFAFNFLERGALFKIGIFLTT